MSDDNIFKRAAYTSLGLMLLGAKKADNLVKELGSKANLPESEVKLYLDKLTAEADSARENFNYAMREEVKKYLNKLNIPSREEHERLQRQVEVLQMELDQLKKPKTKTNAPK
ncbi:MAG: phasin family protein [Candidatus Cyclobacteriaceae bacterium M2_1C_046]